MSASLHSQHLALMRGKVISWMRSRMSIGRDGTVPPPTVLTKTKYFSPEIGSLGFLILLVVLANTFVAQKRRRTRDWRRPPARSGALLFAPFCSSSLLLVANVRNGDLMG